MALAMAALRLSAIDLAKRAAQAGVSAAGAAEKTAEPEKQTPEWLKKPNFPPKSGGFVGRY